MANHPLEVGWLLWHDISIKFTESLYGSLLGNSGNCTGGATCDMILNGIDLFGGDSASFILSLDSTIYSQHFNIALCAFSF